MKESKRTPRLRRALRLGFWVLLGMILSSIALVALLRVVNPIGSGIQAYRQFEAWRAERNFQPRQCWLDLAAMGDHLPMAVIAAEDQRFRTHWGFDLVEIKAAVSDRQARSRGASTISQQTAKNLFLWPQRSWLRKALEAYFTVLIESFWSKPRILEIYLNSIEFGPGVFGACAGARHHFRTEVAQLSPQQAAQLAAILPNPHAMTANPPSPYVRARAARLLRQMRQLGGAAYLRSL